MTLNEGLTVLGASVSWIVGISDEAFDEQAIFQSIGHEVREHDS